MPGHGEACSPALASLQATDLLCSPGQNRSRERRGHGGILGPRASPHLPRALAEQETRGVALTRTPECVSFSVLVSRQPTMNSVSTRRHLLYVRIHVANRKDH